MKLLLDALAAMPEVASALEHLARRETVAVSGVTGLPRTVILAAILEKRQEPAAIVCQDEMAARRIQAELLSLLGETFPILPAREWTFYDTAAASRDWEHRRLRVLYDLLTGAAKTVIVPQGALAQRTLPPDVLKKASFTIRCGDELELAAVSDRLVSCGYSRTSLVEGPGQFALRGGILDVYSVGDEAAVRIELFDRTVDCIGTFDVLTQRRVENLESVTVLPAAETLPTLHPAGAAGLCEDLRSLIARQKRRRHPNEELIATLTKDAEAVTEKLSFSAADRYMALIYPEFACAADYLPSSATVYFCDHGAVFRAARARGEDFGLELDGFLQAGLLAGELCDFVADAENAAERLAPRPAVFFDAFLAAKFPDALAPGELIAVTGKQLPSYGGNLDSASEDIRHYAQADFATLVLCGSRRRAELLEELLAPRGVNAHIAIPTERLPRAGEIFLSDGALPEGLEYPTLRLAVLTEGQLTALRPTRKVSARSKPKGQKLRSFTDLSEGDYVVHEQHGIGKYLGVEQIRVDGVVKDYIRIAYQGDDTLFIPATQLDLISKYVGGGEESTVRLSKLGGEAWKKTKAHAKSAARELAGKLIQIYAQRRRLPGFPFSADTPWQREFEDAFPYAETDDQLRCVEEIKKDMESPTPMDRLLCGDVGFGKTEVALRAAMKAILDSKQVALLAPTTVLAQQHYLTCLSRFRGYPVVIDVLSRFRTPAQQKKTMEDLARGKVDLIVGTHKLLQKDVRFRNLGLLIVDEEQRFGVTHKERLKEMSVGVDVLTLSATPIPRTLNMALSGLRDMSTIEEPPRDRYPVQTFVLEHNEAILRDAMQRELDRGGQVYYLHNRTEDIEETAAKIRRLLGGTAEVAAAHGKMNEEALSDVMQRMADGEVQILVCTTIIETGVDISNVNTLIIEDADRLGLSQLHQIRGRVGRANRHAFAYLTFRRGKMLSEIAEKRLNAIREFAEFGSGFKIAMRDLEIRGAGDLLGAEQSGHILSVGYDLYLKLLEDAVLEAKGEERPKEPDCTCDLTVEANISRDYVPSPEQRMDLYRRMATIRTQEEADDLLDEIVDRFGDPPKGVLNLIAIALLRAQASRAGVSDIRQKDGCVLLTLWKTDFSAVSAACADPKMRGKLLFSAGKVPMLTARLAKGEDPLKLASLVVRSYAPVTDL